jgi:putative transposase
MPIRITTAAPTAEKVCHHLTWIVKYRCAALSGPVACRLDTLVRQEAAKLGLEVLALAVAADHVHVCVAAPASLPVPRIINQFKGVSSCLIGREFPVLHRRLPRLWAGSYFARTVDDQAAIEAIVGYIVRHARV